MQQFLDLKLSGGFSQVSNCQYVHVFSGHFLCCCDLWTNGFKSVLWSLTNLSVQSFWVLQRLCIIVFSNNYCNVYIHKIHVCLHLETNETNGWQSNCKNCYNSSSSYEPTFHNHLVTITGSTIQKCSKIIISGVQACLVDTKLHVKQLHTLFFL